MGTYTNVVPIIVVLGATASGKSQLGLNIAQKFKGEIIAADSRTIYRGMDIGTAKPTREECLAVPHHLINITTPDKVFSVAEYQSQAKHAIENISCHSALPIIVGGTGLYIDAVIYDFSFRQPASSKLRQELNTLSVENLQQRIINLGLMLPTNSKNPRHLIRVIETNGEIAKRKPLRSNTLVLGLQPQKEVLEQRIEDRVQAMFQNGLEQEVRGLVAMYGWEAPPLRTIGYQEFRDYFDGNCSLEVVSERIIQNTKAYAKRQRTWFKRNRDVHYIGDQTEAVDLVTTFLASLSNTF